MFWVSSNQRRRTEGRALTMALLAAALAAAGCPRGAPATAAAPKTVGDWFTVKVGDESVQMQLAIYPAEMEHGLMERTSLGRDQGMLFVYREPAAMSFWMRDMPLPLDIGFFDRAGELKEIYAMLPYDETSIRSRDQRLQFALEMNQGWFHDRGVRPGAKLDRAALVAALKARGATPADFGLR